MVYVGFNSILKYAGWTFLPNLVTGWLQTFYYGVTIRAGEPKPSPGSPKYQKHRRRILITVILAYLLFTIYEVDYDIRQTSDFYQFLGITHDTDDRGIKSRFRKLAAIHHPDKASPAFSSTGDHAGSDEYFVLLKLAQDTLLNPSKRFAYDRFGPDILQWQHCSVPVDYLLVGLQTTAPVYALSATSMILLSVTGKLQWGRYWRYLSFAFLVILELFTWTRPFYPPILSLFINPILQNLTAHPPLLPFQLLTLARKATLTFFIALSQLGPLIQPSASNPTLSSSPAADLLQQQQLQKLEQSAMANEVEASRLLALDMAPFVGDDGALTELSARVREWLVQNTIRADPQVRDAVGRALGKRRVGAPSGARQRAQ